MAVHQAADGGLARVRLPGGVLTAAQLRVLSAAATDLGDGQLELTSRANVQLRGLADRSLPDLSQRLYESGLLPSLTHERVRNILTSPLSGLDATSSYDVLPVTATVDRLLCATPVLSGLPGRFLFALDDGRGDVAHLADIAVRAVSRERATLWLAGTDTGVLLPWEAVPATLVAAAEAFLAERTAQASTAWRLAELTNGPARLLTRLTLTPPDSPNTTSGRAGDVAERGVRADADRPLDVSAAPDGPAARAARVGAHRGPEGRMAVVVAVPLGRLTAGQTAVLADRAEGAGGAVRITRWRTVVVPDVALEVPEAPTEQGAASVVAGGKLLRELERAGLVVDAGSAWIGMTGCAGRPGCAKAHADVRADAAAALPVLPAGRAVHWSGCERRCGRPGGSVDVVAMGHGYQVDGVPVADVTAAVAARRTEA